ncbi:olfactory receptor 4Q2-like [Lacerta agilis]|uniref:olfactory receptor 4Q2-like n=1 Tax=Lacerta agilis TaxID=80427 RepID=UPI001419CAC4|nr:olfactory receptor 4Q2-like [Lacerta agilis]
MDHLKGNYTRVNEFLFVALSPTWQSQFTLFVFFLLVYATTLVGNSLIMLAVTSDPRLRTPMYFLLGNLSFLDLCYSNVTTPKMLVDFLSEKKSISFDACMAQLFFLHLLAAAEMFLLTVMAYDRYVAICKPLHYPNIMNRELCSWLVAASWTGGFIHSMVQLLLTIGLPYCGPNQLDNFFCDVPPVIKLACTDTYITELLIVSNSGLISASCFVLLVISYATILVRIRSPEGRRKALNVCASHLIVVTLFFGPCIFIYTEPLSAITVDKLTHVLYNINLITPMLNPIIYTLRNKDVKSAIRKLTGKEMISDGKVET